MSSLKDYYGITLSLLELCQNRTDPEKREAEINEIHKLLDEREDLLPTIESPSSEEEKRLGQEVIKIEEELQLYLSDMKKEIAADIRDVQRKKVNQNRYSNPYQSLATDGMFYDKRN